MIRNVVTGRLADPTDVAASAQLDAGLAGVAALELPGLVGCTAGRDLGLRAGGADFAIVGDFVDAAAYVAYDHDPAHLVHRAAIVAVCSEVSRVQFEVVDARNRRRAPLLSPA